MHCFAIWFVFLVIFLFSFGDDFKPHVRDAEKKILIPWDTSVYFTTLFLKRWDDVRNLTTRRTSPEAYSKENYDKLKRMLNWFAFSQQTFG